ncbi:MAG: hypothetical protein HYU97_10430 [Deltaproteobacteria bacterium]|nr:hypothetical protein [Deltaproteobacteria bacterium]
MKQNTPKVMAILATGTAFLGSCCALPLLLLGLTGTVGFATVLVPYQKYFTVITVVLLAVAFYFTYGRKTVTCEDSKLCSPKSQRVTKILLWVSTGLVLIFLIGPQIITWLIAS